MLSMSLGRFVVLCALALVPLVACAGSAPPRPTVTRDLRDVPAADRVPWETGRQGAFAMCATRDRSGRLWVGTEASGLWCWDGSRWTQYTRKEGLGDDCIYALAADRLGRIWAGHLNHGVSVYNGERWRTYDIFDGPLGARIFAIAVCPADGDVWIAADGGLSRYSQKDDTWSYYTRGGGLPSDQIQSIAFDAAGNIILGSQCDGIALADRADGYTRWRTIRHEGRLPVVPAGEGLPGNCINQVLVAGDGSIWVATSAGLARSRDQGQTWRFVRGADWEAKVRGRTGGPPEGWQPEKGPILAEDYVNALAEDPSGLLWVGYRRQGLECLDPRTEAWQPVNGLSRTNPQYISFIAVGTSGPPLAGSYGQGLVTLEKAPALQLASLPFFGSPATPPLPSPAGAPSPKTLAFVLAQLESGGPAPLPPTFLGDDWQTQGDWIGRYGRSATTNAGATAAVRMARTNSSGFGKTGPNNAVENGPVYSYLHANDSNDRRALQLPDPLAGQRELREWNDGSFEYPVGDPREGPDLWMSVIVPAGVTRVSLYFANPDKSGSNNRIRDYLVEVRPWGNEVRPTVENDLSPPLACGRVVNFSGGVYKQFLLREGQYWIKINRNYSFVAKTFGLFLDPIKVPDSRNRLPLAQPPPAPPPPDMDPVDERSAALAAARALWERLDADADLAAAAPWQRLGRVLAYRLAAANGADKALLASWRGVLTWWTADELRAAGSWP